MSYALNPEHLADPRNAHYLALACDLAYLPEPEGKKAFLDQLGLEARLISIDNTQAYIATNSDAIVVAFRGTESPASLDGLKDWLLTNAVNLLVLPQGRLGTDFAAAGVGARFHQGFLNALAEIWDPVCDLTETAIDENPRPLWLTGHSLGGALATLTGWLFLRRMVEITGIFTYGAPMVGNDQAMLAFDRELGNLTYRFVDVDDPIPWLPTVSLIANTYKHCDTEYKLGRASTSDTALGLFQKFGSRVGDLLTGKLLDEFWGEINRRVSCHMMANYQKKLPDA